MHLAVDAQTLQTAGARRGIGRYARNLLHALVAVRPDWRIEAVLNTRLPALGAGAIVPGLRVREFIPPRPLREETREVNERYFADWLTATGADAVLELSFFDEQAVVPEFVGPRPALAGIAYDLVPVLFHEHYLSHPAARAIYRRRFRQCVQADRLLAISETTRRDVLRMMRFPPETVVTIGGAGERPDTAPSSPGVQAATLERLGLDRPFLLYVGGPDLRKNLRGMLAAFAALPEDLRTEYLLAIVCALTPEQTAVLEREAEELGISRRLRLTGYVDDDDLDTLYATCRLSVFPSFYEGLGLPVLEALQSGAPVVASNRSAIPEFAAGAARLVDPSSAAMIAEAIQDTLAEPHANGERGRRAAAATFTWAATATRAAVAIQTLTSLSRARVRNRIRVAWVSPVPPAQTESARRTAALLPVLREAFELELVVDAGCTVAPGAVDGILVLRPDGVWDRHRAAPFDLFVYHLQDDTDRAHAMDLLTWRTGLIVLHASGGDARGRWTGALPFGDGIIVHSHAEWTDVRQRTAAPVYCAADEAVAAAEYMAAIRLTAARRAWGDADWRDVVSGALAEAGSSLEDGLIDGWAQLRTEARAVTGSR